MRTFLIDSSYYPMPMEDKLISKFVRFPLTMNVYITNRYPINVYISGN